MVRPIVCIVLLTSAARAIAEPPPLSSALAVQQALHRGRELLQAGKAAEAVVVLEEQLPFINGNAAFLSALREAYGEAIKQLQLAHREGQAAEYQKRLRILESAPPPNTARAAKADEVAAQKTEPPAQASSATAELGAAAEKAFAEGHYSEANKLFTQWAATSPGVAKTHGPQWAYCQLFVVHERLAQCYGAIQPAALTELDSLIGSALSMEPEGKLAAVGQQLREELHRRRDTAGSVVEVRHADNGPDGSAIAETPNFRLFHKAPRDRAEQVVRAAESARAAAILQWGDAGRGSWKPACDIYLHANAADYARLTGKSAAGTGHATYQWKDGAVVRRRLDLRADEPSLITGVIPHETTHLVLADLFGEAGLPRWADEGMAVLSEPRRQIDRYMRTLYRCRAQGELMHLAQLMARSDYPEAAQVTAFYVESVSIVDFLVSERDPKTFVQFVRDLPRGSLDSALQKHYQCANVQELESRWLRKLFPDEVGRAKR